MAVRFQGGKMIPANDNSGASARNASAKLSALASGVDEVSRMLKRDAQGNTRVLALVAELDAIRASISSASKKLAAVR